VINSGPPSPPFNLYIDAKAHLSVRQSRYRLHGTMLVSREAPGPGVNIHIYCPLVMLLRKL
jgi:hypothetical protein